MHALMVFMELITNAELWHNFAAYRQYAVIAEETAGDTAAKMRRLTRELRDLNGKTPLPLHPDSSIFLRHDADRIDKIRFMITGTAPPHRPSAALHKLAIMCSH